MYLPGTAVEIAKSSTLTRKTKKFLDGGEKKRKGRGYRYEFVEVPPEQADELIEIFEGWLSKGNHGIAESAAVRNAVERLGGEVEATPADEERRARAKLKNIRKAQEARLRKQREKADKIERYEKAISFWLSNYRPLPEPAELQGGHPLAVEKLNRLATERAEAVQHVKDLYATLHSIRDTPDNQAERDGVRVEIEQAVADRNLVHRALLKQRHKMASPERRKAADLPIPQPEDFGLTRKDVR